MRAGFERKTFAADRFGGFAIANELNRFSVPGIYDGSVAAFLAEQCCAAGRFAFEVGRDQESSDGAERATRIGAHGLVHISRPGVAL